MPDFIQSATDDQIALMCCFGAVIVSGLIMHFSHFVNSSAAKTAAIPQAGKPVIARTVTMPAQRRDKAA